MMIMTMLIIMPFLMASMAMMKILKTTTEMVRRGDIDVQSNTEGLFPHETNAFCKGHSVVRSVSSLASHTPLIRSAALRSIHGLAHSLRSIPLGMVEISDNVFTLFTRYKRINAIVVVT